MTAESKFLCQDLNKKLARWFSTRMDARYVIMSMHKSFRNDCSSPAGQVVVQGKPLQKEIEDYQQVLIAESMQNCRCNDQPVEKCESCPNKENTNCQ